MTSEGTKAPEDNRAKSREGLMIRGVVLFNAALIAVSWTRWFSGDAKHVGWADRLFGQIRFGGFRADFLWIVLSTAALGIAFLYFASQSFRSREARVNAMFCLCGIVAFCLFIYRVLTTGVLDFG
jgi:hypothetical protein